MVHIDNVNILLGDELKRVLRKGAVVKIIAPSFSVYAFAALKKELLGVSSFEFIYSVPTFTLGNTPDGFDLEHREFHLPQSRRELDLYGSSFEIQLRNQLTQKSISKDLSDWIRAKGVFLSSTSSAPLLNQFIYVESSIDTTVFSPTPQGFTPMGLGYQNTEQMAALMSKSEGVSQTKQFAELFDQLSKKTEQVEDVTENLCRHIEAVYAESSPQKIYNFILYNIFSKYLGATDEQNMPNERINYKETAIWKHLYDFQRDAAVEIVSKLERFNGCLLADSVGLGKTFTALAVIKYYELRNQSVLVLCPKRLADNWQTYNKPLRNNILAEDRLRYTVLNHTDLNREKGESYGINLKNINWENFDLVVIDESHNFRNHNPRSDIETRYTKLLNDVIKKGVKTKVLMLSATPVNNRFSDLRNQLALAYEGDSENLSSKLDTGKSIEAIFKDAQGVFNEWERMESDRRTASVLQNRLGFDFFNLLDSVTIARSRKHIQTFYDMEKIGSFPQRLATKTVRCPLSDLKGSISLDDIYSKLSNLTMAAYTPLAYVFDSKRKKYDDKYDTKLSTGGDLKQSNRELGLKTLIRTNCLKRLESSVDSFRITLERLQQYYDETIVKVADVEQRNSEFSVHEIDIPEEELFSEYNDARGLDDFLLSRGQVEISLKDIDLTKWSQSLKDDHNIIRSLISELSNITPEHDIKLQNLVQRIKDKVENPINPANRKVLLFTVYADTAHYLYNNLAPKLATLGLNTAMVTGSSNNPLNTLHGSEPNKHDFQSILTAFSPLSKSRNLIDPDNTDEIDVLIGTDCISEGQNLQDCDYVINYDIHWNPVRIVQRFGRIDRIGSSNKHIQLVNYWPDINLDDYINLKERVENRMVIVNLSATGDDNLLHQDKVSLDFRNDQLRRLQNGDIIDLDDTSKGVSITDLGLNNFRMELHAYMKNNNTFRNMPNGLHTVVHPMPSLDLPTGTLFALRNCSNAINTKDSNHIFPYYLIYMADNGEVFLGYSEVKKLLDAAKALCQKHDDPIPTAYTKFNAITNDGFDMSAYSDLLEKAVQAMINTEKEREIDALFSGGDIVSSKDLISGLKDFELIAFIAIVEQGGAK